MTLVAIPQESPIPGQRIRDAVHAIQACERIHVETVNSAKNDVQTAVDAGRDAGMTWGAVADALGLTRGCAYQRYRPH